MGKKKVLINAVVSKEMMNNMKLLAKLLTKELPVNVGVTKTEYYTPHVESLVAIGVDHTASIVMSQEAYDELMKLVLGEDNE